VIALAFLVFIMIANNSWPWVIARLQRGIPKPGEGNPILPVPPPSEIPDHINVPEGTPNTTGPTPGTILPVPEESQTPFQITPVP
jgi:hypothetical protein